MMSGGSNVAAPSSNDARYNELSHTGGESLASSSDMRNDITDVCPIPLSSEACGWNGGRVKMTFVA